MTLPQQIAPAVLSQAFAARNLVYLGGVDLELEQDFARYQDWLDTHDIGAMTYLRDHAAIRSEPARLLPSARAAWVVGFNYYAGDRYGELKKRNAPSIAQYARRRDYHRTMRDACTQTIAQLIRATPGLEGLEFRVCVDTAPLLERALAAKTAHGLVGKNSMFIDWRSGSYLLLAIVLVNVPVATVGDVVTATPSDDGYRKACGTCKRCQVHCPTNALQQDFKIDATKCLAYWTIEHRGVVPFEYWPYFRQYIFGCDICQLVCPFNRIAKVETPTSIAATIDPYIVATLDQPTYVKLFGGTPVTRAKLNGLRRNGIIALAAAGDPRLAPLIANRADETDPVVRETLDQASVWCQKRVSSRPESKG